MARIKIDLPGSFRFSCTIPVRITDLNYGKHVGNDQVLSLLHEARMQFLHHLGYTELEFEGVSLIMNDAAIQFKKEMYYGDMLLISVTAGDITTSGFDLFYKIEVGDDRQKQLAVIGKTGMTCYDYSKKKVVAIPAAASEKLSAN